MNRFLPATPVAFGLVVSLTVVAAATPAMAQLTPVGAPSTFVISDPAGAFTEVPGGEFDTAFSSGGAGSYTLDLSGDGHLAVETNQPIAAVAAVQAFEPVGPLPVEVTISLDWSFKVVNGGGTAGSPASTTYLQGFIAEIGTLDLASSTRNNIVGASGANATVVGEEVDAVVGNGFTVYTGSLSVDPYVLAPGVEYVAATQFSLFVNGSELVDGDPTSVVTLEAGGISGFSGMTMTIDYRVVPEPAGLAVVALAPAALLRRRRRGS